jgi:mannose-1-phosphate guanylyltransferase/phosphomannomutase
VFLRALVLAAGEGQRLRPLTLDRPKLMLSIGSRPLLEQIVLLLRRHGITEIAINLHRKPQAIVDYFSQGECLGVQIQYSYEEELLGSAEAARKLDRYLRDDAFGFLWRSVYRSRYRRVDRCP